MTLSLLDKVRSASGADRELDWHIADATDHPSFYRRFEHMWPPFGPGSKLDRDIPYYTSSVDACLALVERKLPGWVVEHIGNEAIGRIGNMAAIGWTFEISNGLNTHQGQSEKLPLAILVALLLALNPAEANNE